MELTRSGPDSVVRQVSTGQLVIYLVFSLAIMLRSTSVNSIPNMVGHTPTQDYPKAPIDNLSVQDMSVDIEEPISLIRTNPSIPVSGSWEFTSVLSQS